jgi:HAD superfamily hydrolase (TIGR01509 family)
VSEPQIHAFVFDMDGTILDNMGFHTEAWMQTIEELGQPPRDPREWERITSGTPNHEIFRNLLGLEGLDDAGVNHWVERKEGLYREKAVDRLVELPGFSKFLARARDLDIRLGLATGAGPSNISFNLEALGLVDAFDTIVGAIDVVKGKPDPEVFLTSAARLGVPPASVLVFEDAPLGIDAARAAGMSVVGITTMMSVDALLEISNVKHAIQDFEALHPATLVGRES